MAKTDNFTHESNKNPIQYGAMAKIRKLRYKSNVSMKK